MTEPVTIIGDTPIGAPPTWALLERALFDSIDRTLDTVLARYTRPDGSVMWPPGDDYTGIDALDDAYESFFNWPLYYLLGGSADFLDASHREFDAITRQFARYQTGFGHPIVVNEYEQGYDWFHQAEGYTFFSFLCLADPAHPASRERALRFADLYVETGSGNWDPERRMVTSPHTGSMGPASRNFSAAQFRPYAYGEHLRWAGLPFQDVPGVTSPDDLRAPAGAEAMGEIVERRTSRGDVPVNLAITGLVTGAYLFSGDDRYRDWVVDYTEAWVERAERNGGIIPDNVGPSGAIGETMDGKWYGGNYGWSWPTGWESIGSGLMCAATNALLVTGDRAFLDLPRSQLRELLNRSIRFRGTIHMPTRYGDPGFYDLDSIFGALRGTDPADPLPTNADGPVLWTDGWFDFVPVNPEIPVLLWLLSMSPEDRGTLAGTLNALEAEPEGIANRSSWRPTYRKNQAGQERAWLAFLSGDNPDFPEEMLRFSLAQVHQRMAFIRSDDQDPATYSDSYLQQRNPVVVEALLQLTLGAPMPLYNGGLLVSRLRYFDARARRPGLPPDVAALVRNLRNDGVTVELVNLDPVETRVVMLQAGAYGEHRFSEVAFTRRADDGVTGSSHFDPDHSVPVTMDQLDIGGPHFTVELRPGSSVMLDIGIDLFASRPSYATPY